MSSRRATFARDDARSSRPRRLAALALALAATAFTARARADAERIGVSYTAPAGCSSRDAFVRELRRRTTRVEVTDANDAGSRFVVELVDRGSQIVGRFDFIEPSGADTARAVSGATCDEVVPALALIAAVLVDPESLGRARAAEAAHGPPAEKPRSFLLRPSVGAGAEVSMALAPSAAFAPMLELGLEAELGDRRGPALSLAGARFTSPTRSTEAGDADFTTTLARLTLCPLRWPPRGPLFGSACAAFEAGALDAKGSRTLGGHQYSSLWLAADPELAFEYRPLRSLGIGLGVLGVFPLVRDHYLFGPNVAVFSVPVAGVTGQVSVRFVLF